MSERAADDDDDLPRLFGSYTLLARLGQGGMGEVFLAAKGGIEGISRRCVVKTLRPGFTDDREYVARFLDEARVVAQLHHRNICPTFEVGKVDSRYFLAMEYIAGRDLKTVCERATKAATPLSSLLALHVVSETLDALDYAHALNDATTGEPMLLVHRDVSPHNVMVGFDGDVRLIDFGLAASTLKVEQTAPNVVMGKVAYMAPEHICGDPIDARADQFAVGVMAAELFLGHRFYEGRSTRELYALAAPGGFRPSTWTNLPKALATVLDRALASNPVDRFATCGAFRDALLDARSSLGDDRADMPALRALMRGVFADDIVRERTLLTRAAIEGGVPASHVISASVPASVQPRVEDTQRESVGVTVREQRDITRMTQSAAAARAPTTTPNATTPNATTPTTTTKLALMAAAAAAVAVAAIAITIAVLPSSTPTPPLVTPPVTAPPVTAPPVTAPPVTAPVTIRTAVETVTPTPPPPLETIAPKTKLPKTKLAKTPTTPTPTPTPTTSTTTMPPAPSTTAPPGTRLRYVLQQCATLPCAAGLKAHSADWATLENEAQERFQSDLKTCFSRCAKP